MSFIGKTKERKITSNGKTYKIFITEQEGGFWVATILYTVSGKVTTHNEVANTEADAYKQACDWFLNNVDKNAQIETL